ncbi:hypothetical protein NC652_023853 [Populus alba x Populus x berolinensis]|nr:hypothetical protein NC652_023853 [Populus alba x Populus x berolinensis]
MQASKDRLDAVVWALKEQVVLEDASCKFPRTGIIAYGHGQYLVTVCCHLSSSFDRIYWTMGLAIWEKTTGLTPFFTDKGVFPSKNLKFLFNNNYFF